MCLLSPKYWNFSAIGTKVGSTKEVRNSALWLNHLHCKSCQCDQMGSWFSEQGCIVVTVFHPFALMKEWGLSRLELPMLHKCTPAGTTAREP